jgi:dienelactone hydrolase
LWAITVLLLIIVGAALGFRLIFPGHEPLPTTGRYAVSSALYTFTDANRIERYTSSGASRRVNVEFYYPHHAAGVFPLVLFSHGALGIRSSNLSLYRELASHGYVVGALDHPYQAFWTRDDEGKLTLLNLAYLSDLQREDAKTDKAQSFVYYQDWMQTRMEDIQLVLDTVLQKAADDHSGVFGLVDTANIGVMGHSLGGSAALGIGRQRDDIKAVIALEAPFLYDIEGVENDEFMFINAAFPTPVLNIYSDDSWAHLSEWAQYAKNDALLADTSGTAFSVHIHGAGHLALTDLSRSSPFLVGLLDRTPTTRDSDEVLRIINRLSLEFFDAFLKGEGEFTNLQADIDKLGP